MSHHIHNLAGVLFVVAMPILGGMAYIHELIAIRKESKPSKYDELYRDIR